jgi:beta-glucosidase-like glycosyl hydrolase
VVTAALDVLKEQDLTPFRAAIGAGVASIMTAHVSYPALDPSGLPATLSREILQWLLRQQLKYDNLVVADALIMRGVLEGREETDAAVMAVQAGCDVLLQPDDVHAVVTRSKRRAPMAGSIPRCAVGHAPSAQVGAVGLTAQRLASSLGGRHGVGRAAGRSMHSRGARPAAAARVGHRSRDH